ncbi:hypothetical protein [Nonomuraea sp. NPDC050783]|uniref:hypothetical protein n=1 Tax=Nonomuraea sp. NPDC050783 TaxID=3154634 RepID=UPI003464FFBF
MATDNSGPHLPPSWPEAPRRETPAWAGTPSAPDPSPAWAGASATEVPTSWPETPRPAGHDPAWPETPRTTGHDPAWPEPPRPDAGWPEPPRPARPSGPAAGSPGPASDPSFGPSPRPASGSASGPASGSASGPASGSASGRASHSASGPSFGSASGPSFGSASGPSFGSASGSDAGSGAVAGDRRVAGSRSQGAPDGGPAWPEPPRPDAGWPEPPRRDGAPASNVAAWPGDSANGQPFVPDPIPAWQQPPTPTPGAWSNLSTPAPWPPRDQAPAEAPERREPDRQAPAAFGQAALDQRPFDRSATPPGTPPHNGPDSGPRHEPRYGPDHGLHGLPGSGPHDGTHSPNGLPGNGQHNGTHRPPGGGPYDGSPNPNGLPGNGQHDGTHRPQDGPYDRPQDGPPVPQGPPAQLHPSDERTVTYAQTQNLLNDRAVPSTPMEPTHIGTPPTPPPGPPAEDPHGRPQGGGGPRPGAGLSRDPSDPENRFVTAGQISGSRTPPPERQQELWNTVFGDDYQAMGDRDALDDEDRGKPIWIYALGGSVVIALVAALLWAFLAGPLAGEDPAGTAALAEPSASASASQKAGTTKSSTSIGPLPKYSGKASPVIGRVPDQAAGISVPRLGGTWRLDQRATVKATYGYDTRQYVPITDDKAAMVMSGPLPQRLASYYDQDDLEPVIKQVVLDARKRFFPADNKVRKIAQQAIKVGDKTGRLVAYSLTSSTDKATVVTMAVNTGGSVPAIVYVSIPAESKQLLPDIRVVMNQLRLGAQS